MDSMTSIPDEAEWPDVFGKWYVRGWKGVFGYCYARCRKVELAWDATQDGASKINERKDSLDFPAYPPFKTFWCLCSRTALRKSTKSDGKYVLVGDLLEQAFGDGDQRANTAGRGQALRTKVEHILSLMSPLHRQLLVMKYIEGRTQTEIAVALGMSNAWVSDELAKARLAFSKLWLKHYPDDLAG